MSMRTMLHLFAAALIALVGLFVARGQGVVLTLEGLGLLMIGSAVVLMVRAINGHFDRG